jgi:hypothetical protein
MNIFIGLVYFLFQKKWLPRRVIIFIFLHFTKIKILLKPIHLTQKYSRIVSKLLFYPTLPITLLMRLGNYWTVVDDTVFLGCAPIDALGVPDSIHRLVRREDHHIHTYMHEHTCMNIHIYHTHHLPFTSLVY